MVFFRLNLEYRIRTGDIGHPVQYDNTIGQWYINVNDNNEIYNTVVGLGTTSLGAATPKTFISRTPDNRGLDDGVYKVRYVVPKDSTVLGRPPEDSFVIQESSTTVGFTNNEVAKFKNTTPVFFPIRLKSESRFISELIGMLLLVLLRLKLRFHTTVCRI